MQYTITCFYEFMLKRAILTPQIYLMKKICTEIKNYGCFNINNQLSIQFNNSSTITLKQEIKTKLKRNSETREDGRTDRVISIVPNFVWFKVVKIMEPPFFRRDNKELMKFFENFFLKIFTSRIFWPGKRYLTCMWKHLQVG